MTRFPVKIKALMTTCNDKWIYGITRHPRCTWNRSYNNTEIVKVIRGHGRPQKHSKEGGGEKTNKKAPLHMDKKTPHMKKRLAKMLPHGEEVHPPGEKKEQKGPLYRCWFFFWGGGGFSSGGGKRILLPPCGRCVHVRAAVINNRNVIGLIKE